MPFAATWMQLELLILSEVTRREKDKYHMMSIVCETEHVALMNLSIDIENRLVVAREEGAGEGWTGSLGLVDASYYI